MTRNQAIRLGVFTMFGMALGKYDALAQEGGALTANLDQWRFILFQYKGQSIRVPVGDVFAAIAEGFEPKEPS